ncbi:MAG: GlsB/YeaQ/YmgE family stress response membrane protein [Candidatus Methylomirabilota bacterium]
MNLELFVMWVVVGLMAGWLARIVIKGGGYGLIGDISLGLVGSIVGSVIFRGLEISPGAGMFMLVVVAFVGAAIAIVVQRKFWYAPA